MDMKLKLIMIKSIQQKTTNFYKNSIPVLGWNLYFVEAIQNLLGHFKA